MPKDKTLKKILVIGSGPIVIGQAAEFDYAGTQACRSLREEGIQTVLVNSNPATIMTDLEIADVVYIEPLTVDFVASVIEKERPDGLLPTLGGQTGLNLASELSGAKVLEKHNVRLLGTSIEAIKKAEDRESFKQLMKELKEPIPDSKTCTNLFEAQEFAVKAGFPLIVRPAYTLGGTGGGIVKDEKELVETVHRGLSLSMIGQVLVEQCVTGWKEIEYEVMRDGYDNCITVCNMENLDPMGIHTGDSIVIAPSQTLSDREYQMLRSASLKIIRGLGIEGGCNVQYALDPKSLKYFVIEVNPRVSRSSALASKATGYPIARVSAKISIGLRLNEIKNRVTGETTAAFEPALDYVVVKIPRWPFDKFHTASREIGTQMKATGEVMAIDRTFESALQKAIRSLEIGVWGPRMRQIEFLSQAALEEKLETPTDERLFAVFEALRRKVTVQEIHELTGMDPWFLHKMKNIISMEEKLDGKKLEEVNDETLKQAKKVGFSDRYLAELLDETEEAVRKKRYSAGTKPVYKMVDTCAAEFEAKTSYYYSTYEKEDDCETDSRRKTKVVVLGSGPIRIGQGIEFDYCSVHSVFTLEEENIDSILINNNPETVSTDFDISDRLYFEPLTLEDVLHVLEKEKPRGVVLQLGGQTPLNLAKGLAAAGIRILGTSEERIDIAEDRNRFENLLRRVDIPRPPGKAVDSVDEAIAAAKDIGFPVLVRPSYVLGGRAMEIVFNEDQLSTYMHLAVQVNPEHPVLVDKYFAGKEVEVDALCDGEDVLIPGIMEHIERAGVHSGDSMAVCPPQTLSKNVISQIEEHTVKIGKALRTKGLMNVQYVVCDGKVYVLEVNPRASRTVPYLSKVVGLPLIKLATHIMLGKKLKDLGFTTGIYKAPAHVGVKAPVFSFSKLTELDVGLGPEMKSTGEIMGIDENFPKALYKALVAAGISLPKKGSIVITVADKDKPEAVAVAKGFSEYGFKILATSGTADFLEEKGIQTTKVKKIHEGSPNLVDLIKEGKVTLLINTLSPDKVPEKEGAKIRRASVELNIPCLTSLDTANALLTALSARGKGEKLQTRSLNEYLKNQF